MTNSSNARVQQRLGVNSPKLVCIDIQPYGSTQAPELADAGRFVAEVESIKL